MRYYFDWAATAMPEDFSCGVLPFGNPSSKHAEGRAARAALEDARSRCAAVLDVAPEQLYFTSGGTESDAIVLYSYYKNKKNSAGALLASEAEHPAVLENCKTIKNLGADVSFVGLENSGCVTCATLEKAFSRPPPATMLSIMHVNNETGAVNDIKKLAAFTKEYSQKNNARKIFFHSDMVQALGKIPINLAEWELDAASFAAHKIGGPRGIGLLYLKKPIDVLIAGGGHERGVRSGTENVAGALAFAHCMELYASKNNLIANYNAATERMNYLIGELQKIPRAKITPETRGGATNENAALYSPYILLCAFENIPGEVMQRALDDAGFAVSTGAACASSRKAKNSNIIRISQGARTTKTDIDALLNAIRNTLNAL